MRANEINLHLAIANNLFSNTAHFGGCSINKDFIAPKSGYLVSVYKGLVFDNISLVNEHELSSFIKDKLSWIDGNYYFGGWIDQQTRKVYFDISRNTDDFDYAMKIAKEDNEIAIWDLNENKEIRVN